ncbi:MAG: ribonuclease P protein component [Gammaproteobacteria bacterium]
MGRFPRTSRLTKPSDFKEVFNSSYRSGDREFLVLAKPNGQTFARLGLAISKRRVPTAVGRNRVKRLIRESFRRHQDSLKGFDIVVMSQKGSNDKDNKTLKDSLSVHWKRLRKCRKS